MSGMIISMSGKILPYCNQVDINNLKVQSPPSRMYLELNTMQDNGFKGSLAFQSTMAECGISRDLFFLDSQARLAINLAEISSELKGNHVKKMKFDENANKVLGKNNIRTFIDPRAGLVWFCGMKETPNPFDTAYLLKFLRLSIEDQNAFKERSIKDKINFIKDHYKNNVPVEAKAFGALLQYMRNPLINPDELAIKEPDVILGLSTFKGPAINIASWNNIFAMHVYYSKNFNDVVEFDEINIASKLASTAIEVKQGTKRP